MAPPGEHSPRTVGRYVLYGELASGGMATVHFGRLSGAVGFSRTVAIKRLHPHFAKDPEFVTMFLDEARLCGRIRHPSVVQTLDVVTASGEIFIVMEYVAGEALSKLMKLAAARSLAMPPRVAASIVASVLHGLHAAHQAKDEHGRELGIVHRDVSPQNVLVGADGAARVLDFGVAKAAGRLQTTREGQVKGKIAYMPPEQLSGAPVTRQIDVYAASVVLWEVLAGRRLFDGDTEAIVLARTLEGVVPPPSSIHRELGPEVDALVLRGLARDPKLRFGTAREMALAVEHTMGLASPSEVAAWVDAAAGDELRARARTVAEIELASLDPGGTPAPVASTPDVHSQVSSISVSRPSLPAVFPKKRRTVSFVVAGIAAVAALGGAAVVLASDRDPAGAGRASSPARVEHEPRELTVQGPETATSRAPRSAPSPAARPAPARAAPRPAAGGAACDPPFTIDPATGHKKYKLECLR